ncbi:MAG: carboxypeptidase-like regulatory domain-containing protein [Bacteroidetes bacterium]|nr:MAG: carboxypeptidase-like regulatory domain-containing protein [Bacteroidota bacterium]
MKTYLFLLFACLLTFSAQAAKIFGMVKDENRKPMPFLTIFAENAEKKGFGTTTNVEGNYFLELPNGIYTLSFRFVGYKTLQKQIEIKDSNISLDIDMEIEVMELKEVEIKSNQQDIAYEIIKNAQKKRLFYLNQIEKFACQVYIKGINRIKNSQAKIMGRDLTDIAGIKKDSSGKVSGVVYLSETVSKLFYMLPDRKKEFVISSKVSGKSNALSWNSALDFSINFYENNYFDKQFMSRPMISPISETALFHYNYQFMGTFKEKDIEINKIKVIPKRKGSPLYSGFLYIQENSWRIQSVDLVITKDAGVEFLDSLKIKQVFVPITPEIWLIGTQSSEFDWVAPIFDVKGSGNFVGAYSDYNLKPKFDTKFFDREISKITDDANKKDSLYWEKNRPIPLSKEEINDYREKDSIFVIRESKEFKDSLDQKNNKFKLSNLLFGYTYRNSYKNLNFNIGSPINNLQLNTVEGYNLNINLSVSSRDREKNTYTLFENDLRYGFLSERFYYKAKFFHVFNGINRRYLEVSGGNFIAQFNGQNPISFLQNNFYTYFLEENYLKIYEKAFAKIEVGQQILNGWTVNASLEWSRRSNLKNALLPNKRSYFLEHSNKYFTSNNPQKPFSVPENKDYEPLNYESDQINFEAQNALIAEIRMRIDFAQKYESRPNLRVLIPSRYPKLLLIYRKALGETPNFDFLKVGITDDLPLGQIGLTNYQATFGTFLNKKNVPFMDFAHFNTTKTIFSNQMLNSFFNLPYYQFSTTDDFFEGHLEHHFKGFLTNRIPFLRKLAWHLVAGTHWLYTPVSKEYGEFTVGFENMFKIFRLDYAFTKGQFQGENHVVRFRLNF